MDHTSRAIKLFSVAFLTLAIVGFLGIINNDPVSFKPAGLAIDVTVEGNPCLDACDVDLSQCLDTSDRIFNTCDSSGPIAADCFEAGSDYIDGCVALFKACENTC